MTRGLGEREDGGDAGVGAGEQPGPLLSGAGGEAGGDRLAQFVPPGQVELVRGLLGQAEDAGELGVEAGLQGAHGHVAAVGGGVAAVEGGAAVEEVAAAAVLPDARAEHGVDHRGEVGRAVHDGGVDHLAGAVGAGVVEGGEDAGDEVEGAARVVADQVGGDGRGCVGLADQAEGTGDGDVADVVSGAVGERAFLAPAGHPAVDQARVAGEAGVGADAKAFGDAGAVSLDEDVGALHQVQDAGGAVLGLEVDQDGALVAVGEVQGRVDAEAGAAGAVDTDHVGAEVGEEHRGERARADARQFHHPDAVQGARRGRVRHVFLAPSPADLVTQLM
ncbi:hypothetical protein CCOS2040_28540 [Streptomyces albidoflavus]|nr:hypothetical protein CCOS2040_28540 [Streptomyces albidoflavus]